MSQLCLPVNGIEFYTYPIPLKPTAVVLTLSGVELLGI
jgi:hypothetical protein